MRDVCAKCSRKSYCTEPCEEWLIAMINAQCAGTNCYISENAPNVLRVIGRSVAEKNPGLGPDFISVDKEVYSPYLSLC
ncbi:hypothetical protein [Desulfosporosinus sp. FKB]|uniref:hypothetical protein n=1 Tax=Desulfosporosinus sp. FKB TaxID=1969835 RepID=UPI0014828D7A|nr:hypothetical protein [Desulfosporosinus sp. FKB]